MIKKITFKFAQKHAPPLHTNSFLLDKFSWRKKLAHLATVIATAPGKSFLARRHGGIIDYGFPGKIF
jgi:hypothetical protein